MREQNENDSAHFGGFTGQKLTELETGEVVSLYRPDVQSIYCIFFEMNPILKHDFSYATQF